MLTLQPALSQVRQGTLFCVELCKLSILCDAHVFQGLGLEGVELVVHTLLLHELLGGAGFHELAVLDGDEKIRVPQGGKPVGDHHRGTGTGQDGKGFLDIPFRLGVHGGGGLVQNEDLGILE